MQGQILRWDFESETKEVNDHSLDILTVTYSEFGHPVNTFTLATDERGHIMHKIDYVNNLWRDVTDEDELRYLQSFFDERDRRKMAN